MAVTVVHGQPNGFARNRGTYHGQKMFYPSRARLNNYRPRHATNSPMFMYSDANNYLHEFYANENNNIRQFSQPGNNRQHHHRRAPNNYHRPQHKQQYRPKHFIARKPFVNLRQQGNFQKQKNHQHFHQHYPQQPQQQHFHHHQQQQQQQQHFQYHQQQQQQQNYNHQQGFNNMQQQHYQPTYNQMNSNYMQQYPQNNNKMSNYQGDQDYDQNFNDHDGETLKVAVISRQVPSKMIEVVEGKHDYEPRVVNLEAKTVHPIILNFESLLSPVQTSMSLMNGKGDYGQGQHSTYSVEGAHSHEHTIYRPIELRVNEVYTPFRSIFREVSPVEDSVKTFVHHEHQQDHDEHDAYANPALSLPHHPHK